MARLTNLCVINPYGMRPVSLTMSSKYKRGHLDTEWQKDLILSSQLQDNIYQYPMERGDRFRLAYDTTAPFIGRSLKVLDCNGLTVLTINETATTDVAGNVASDNTQFHSCIHKLSNLSALTDDGVYYLLLSVVYDLNHLDQFISHPLDLRDLHEGTMAIEYEHSQNMGRYYYYPEQLPCRFFLRVHAYIGKVIAKSTRTVYENQEQELSQLDRKAYREFPLCIGYEGPGICEYVYDLINHVFDCDTTRLEGKQYLAANGAELSMEGNEHAVLFAAKINIAPADQLEGFRYGTSTVPLYFTGTYPYAIGSIYIGPTWVSGPAVIEDAPGETAFIAALNTSIATTELQGTIQLSGGLVEYVNGSEESYTVASVQKYNTKFNFTFTVPGSASLFNRTKTIGLGGGNTVVDWGDGNVISASPVAATNYTNIYPNVVGSVAYAVRIFYNTLESFTLGSGYLLSTGASAFAGTLPPTLKQFYLNRVAFAANTFDFAFLSGLSKLQILAITNSGLTAANNFNSYHLQALDQINFSGNAFSNSVVSAFMYDVYRNSDPAVNAVPGATKIINGVFSIVQSPPAILNSTGNIYKSALTASPYNWTVNN